MRYQLRQKLLSIGPDFTIRNDDDMDVFFVDGKAFSLGHQLSFQNMDGHQLAYIRQRLLRLKPTYEIWIGGEHWATVQKELFTLFKCRFVIDVPGPDDYEAEGEFLHHEYRFIRGGRTVASVSKKWFSLSDTYGVEIEDEKDILPVLCGAIVIDLICHHGHNN